MNLYSYCGNNPVMYYDPSGQIALALLLGVLAIVGLGVIIYAETEFRFLENTVKLFGDAANYYINDVDWLQVGEYIGGIFTGIANSITNWWDNSNILFYRKPKPHRKKRNGDKHSNAQRARMLQAGGQKKVKSGRYIPNNPKQPRIFPILWFLYEWISKIEGSDSECFWEIV